MSGYLSNLYLNFLFSSLPKSSLFLSGSCLILLKLSGIGQSKITTCQAVLGSLVKKVNPKLVKDNMGINYGNCPALVQMSQLIKIVCHE